MGLNIDSGALLAIKQVSIAGNSASKEKTQVHIREQKEEVNLLENLSHPNIVRYLGTTIEEASLNILLEIVPGGSISSLLGKFGSFPESVIRMYTKQLLLGVEYLHRNGIMHKDIKGANILVDNKGCIKLADFGASKKVVELATMTGAKSMKGTPYWMAPEVILQTGHSFSADIWSVGCTVIEMATGEPPWSQQYQEVAALLHIGTTKSHPPIPEHLSAEATDFLLKCLQKYIVSKGEILQLNTTNAHNSYLGCGGNHACWAPLQSIGTSCSYPVDGSNPIDITDPRCEILLIVQKKIDLQGGNQLRLLGFAAIYCFYHYPNSLRLRLSQILVLAPYQRKGYGRHLLEVLNNVTICENVYDLTIEEPLDSLQHMRTCIDVGHLLKISQRQAKLKQIDNFMTVISYCVRADVIGKDSGAAEKQVIEFPTDYDQEMSLLEK
ncbi:hypothetical protein ACSBR2_031338 [Camellia fascicularis]